ncbi:hypothetical protein BDL97_05G106300 [Sphagnum fallax]|nr:hypothetical protein BDL97_05G106300 [Sphagnum fallax]
MSTARGRGGRGGGAGPEAGGVGGGRVGRTGIASNSGVQIPASALKVVQSLKEIVRNTDDEIYSMLKICNMDLNETVQRLLNDDNFHEVKRKRDKKKESAAHKDAVEFKGRPGSRGDSTRPGWSGIGRGASPFYHQSHGGRGKPFAAREIGIHPSKRVPSSVPALANLGTQNLQSSVVPASLQAESSINDRSEGLPNGNSSYAQPPPVSQAAWDKGHTTMVDILKSEATLPPLPVVVQSPTPTPNSGLALETASDPAPGSASPPRPATGTTPVQQPVGYSVEMPLMTLAQSSGFYSSSTDSVIHPLLVPHTQGAQGGFKQGIGKVGAQQSIGDQPFNSLTMEVSPVSTSLSQASVAPTVVAQPAAASSSLDTDVEAKATGPTSLSVSVPPQLTDDVPHDEGVTFKARSPVLQTGVSQEDSSLVPVGSQSNGRPLHPSQQLHFGTQKDVPAPSEAVLEIGEVTSKLYLFSMEENGPVVIPNHLKVPEAEYTHLSFGSFGPDFKVGSVTSYQSMETQQSVTVVESIPVDAPVEEPDKYSVVANMSSAESYGHQPQPTPLEKLITQNEVTSISLPAPVSPVTQALELAKAQNMVQRGPQYPYVPTVSNYHGFGLMPQISGGQQYGYEPMDSQPDVPHLPSLMPYTDTVMSYYTPGFRPWTDGDNLYPPYITSNATSKFSGNLDLMSGVPSAFPPQQSGNSLISSSGPSFAPTQPGSNSQITSSTPQQALPIHAYAAQPTQGHYGNFLSYQYMQPNYPYMQTPYQHNYAPSNSVYTQAPSGSNYPPAASPAYLAGGVTPVKYSWPQYKTSTASGNSPHSAATVGYQGYNSTPSGYTINPSMIGGTSTTYEDVGASQYKDNTVYIPGQQVEGSTVWIPTPPPQDMGLTVGIQTNSYYNLAGQGHHNPYSLPQLSAHTHMHPGTVYPTNLYHPSQLGPASSVHQVLQKPLAMGGAVSSAPQAGVYQQPEVTSIF